MCVVTLVLHTLSGAAPGQSAQFVGGPGVSKRLNEFELQREKFTGKDEIYV